MQWELSSSCSREDFAAVMLLRVDPAEAQNIALSQTGGGEIVSQEVSSEGLWNEYSYTIVNGDTWYEIEIWRFRRYRRDRIRFARERAISTEQFCTADFMTDGRKEFRLTNHASFGIIQKVREYYNSIKAQVAKW